jgi:hydroxymethylpyrimidine/phosphomethylpyrimidine kinase
VTTVLSIAGFDPSSGAGVTADLMVFAAHGLFGTACITALTVQSTTGVREVRPVSGETVAETLECLREDLPPAGVKIGMLATSDNVDAVLRYLERLRAVNGKAAVVVLDPVIQASSGARLLDESGLRAMEALLPEVDWVTPNVDELALLNERAIKREIEREAVPDACRELQEKLAKSGADRRVGIFATGGHLDRPDDYLLSPAGEGTWLTGERVRTSSTHGTGCSLSSAFLSRLVLGHSVQESGRMAKAYVAEALRSAVLIGQGRGPMNHLWPLAKAED